jgi:DNA polymerase-3 subunit epsilon
MVSNKQNGLVVRMDLPEETLGLTPYMLAAHNASFDRSVLETCCAAAGLRPPSLAFRCSMQLARSTWGLRPTTLPAVCAHLGIPLQHHDALSDAEACARVLLAAAI